jgi:biopolymer transport protein ExbD
MSNEPLAMFSYSSLTDIVMLLLIFFLLSSQFVIQTGVKVKLPGSKTNEQSAASLVVAITAEGAIYAGKEQVNIDQLPIILEKLKSKDKEQNLVIQADKSAAVDHVIKVIDAAKSVGIEKFTLQTEKEKK